MSKLYKYLEYIYLIFAILFIVLGIFELGNNLTLGLILIAMGAAALFKYFFQRRFRRRFEDRNKQ